MQKHPRPNFAGASKTGPSGHGDFSNRISFGSNHVSLRKSFRYLRKCLWLNHPMITDRNISAGFLFERLPPSFLLFIATLILSLSTCFIPFSPNVNILAAASGAAEFALGLLDTGKKAIEIWTSSWCNLFFRCQCLLPSALGRQKRSLLQRTPLVSGNRIPFGASFERKRFADSRRNWNRRSYWKFQRDSSGRRCPHGPHQHCSSPQSRPDFVPLCRVHHLSHCSMVRISRVVSNFSTISFECFSFLPGIAPDMRIGSYSFPDEDEEKKSGKQNPRLEGLSVTLVIILMTFYFAFGQGLTFAYGNFLTAYAVKSSLKLSQAFGARFEWILTWNEGNFWKGFSYFLFRVTSVYYASQITMRGINIVLVTKLKRIFLVLIFLSLVSSGTLVLFAWNAQWGLMIGSVIVGLGSGSLFPMGLLWLQGHMELSGKITALFCLATTLGAQLFRSEIYHLHTYNL